MFTVMHLHPVVALALCVRVQTKLILEAKLNGMVGRRLEQNTPVRYKHFLSSSHYSFTLKIQPGTQTCALLLVYISTYDHNMYL